MCGRYANFQPGEAARTVRCRRGNAAEPKSPDYHVAPTKVAPVVIARALSDGPKDADPVRQLRLFKVGLVPFWAKEPKIGNRILCTSQIRLVGEARPVCSAERTTTASPCPTCHSGSPCPGRRHNRSSRPGWLGLRLRGTSWELATTAWSAIDRARGSVAHAARPVTQSAGARDSASQRRDRPGS
jgi:hypothetical protein